VKTNLLIEQAQHVQSQLQDVLGMLESDVEGKDNMIRQSVINHKLDSKEALKKMIRVFTNFSFIKNVFEIDSDDFTLEYKCFTLKDSLIYWMNFLMTYYPDSKINLTLDPWLPKNIEGDIVKFHQIIITLVDFALKNSNSVEINSEANYDHKLGGYHVEFIISFVSVIFFNESDLEKMFIPQDDSFFKNLSTYKSIGLALNLTAKLLKVINGSFNKIQREKDGTTVLNFTIPFKMADFSNNPYVHVPSLNALMESSNGQSNCDRIETSDKCVQNISQRCEQESGNEWSNNFQSSDIVMKNNSINTPQEDVSIKNGFSGEISNTGVFVHSKSLFDEKKDKKDFAKTQKNLEQMSPELRLTNKANRQEENNDDWYDDSKNLIRIHENLRGKH
jgi:hypothetical protein